MEKNRVKKQRLRKRMMTVALVGALLLALGAAQAMAQGIPIIFCADQEPQTPECEGTDGFESLVGQDTRDVIKAFAGDDIINAEGGNDNAFGGPGVDNINGKFGNDELSGGSGLDTVSDGVMESGELSTGDVDALRGNSGNDILDTEDDDFLDTINCGKGRKDRAFFDVNPQTGQSDAVAGNCEFRNEFPGG
jgi:Ca2+-binding RTX toxin-like protein